MHCYWSMCRAFDTDNMLCVCIMPLQHRAEKLEKEEDDDDGDEEKKNSAA